MASRIFRDASGKERRLVTLHNPKDESISVSVWAHVSSDVPFAIQRVRVFLDNVYHEFDGKTPPTTTTSHTGKCIHIDGDSDDPNVAITAWYAGKLRLMVFDTSATTAYVSLDESVIGAPVHIVGMPMQKFDGDEVDSIRNASNDAMTRCTCTPPSKPCAHARRVTSLDSDEFDTALAQVTSLPPRKQRKWRFKLHHSSGSSYLIFKDGVLIDVTKDGEQLVKRRELDSGDVRIFTDRGESIVLANNKLKLATPGTMAFE